ncbi:MAG: class I SAM-dependent methyltransferase, partial [Proteobacteria bacterium]|nr:class I SAM-dependent methyltransferase [Pseudomonadota bacterium]
MSPPKLTFADKLLPDQPPHAELFGGDAKALWQALYDTIARSSGIRSPYDEFKLAQTEKFTVEEMASNPVSLRLLQLLIRMIGARRVLEIGAFIGVSAMSMASALPKGGELVTIEKFDHFAAIARQNFKQNGLAKRIRLLEGDAFGVIDSLPKAKKFDLIFIDGNKERYLDYFERLEPLLAPG